MEILEQIAVNVFLPAKEDCWFCKQKPESDKTPTNDLAENPDSVGGPPSIPENDIKNDSSTLGRNLGDRPSWVIEAPNDPDEEAAIVPGAHHLIPGNASYKNAKELHKYVSADKGLIKHDIGYGINHEGNGVWLPGSYGVRADASTTGNKKWSKYKYQEAYAIAAMKCAAGQFHDAHNDYSRNVKETLLSVAEKLDALYEKNGDDKCPVCGSKASDEEGKLTPPLGLVGKLDGISGSHRTMLKGRKMRQKFVDAGYFTSSKVKLIFSAPEE
jgi:hypothetical protein